MTQNNKKASKNPAPRSGKQVRSGPPKRGRNARKSKRKTGGRVKFQGHALFGTYSHQSNVESMPAAFDTIQGNCTFVSGPSRVSHKQTGLMGVQLFGCQPLYDITTDGTTSGCLVNSTLAEYITANLAPLSPDSLNGPLAAQANLYDRFVFRDVLIEYSSNVATSQAGSMAMAIVPDGNTASQAPTTFSTTRQCNPSITFPFRHDKAYLHYHYSGEELYYNRYDSATTAGTRLTNQATMCFYPSASSIGAISQGFTNIWYVVELYGPVSTQGFSVTVSRTERDLVEGYLKRLRLGADDRDDVISVSSTRSLPRRA